MTAPFSFPAIRVSQPLGIFYLAAIPAALLLKVGYTKQHRRLKADVSGVVDDDGHQRRLDSRRLTEIGRYLDTQDATIPNTIILAANCIGSGEPLDIDDPRRWHIKPDEGVAVELNIPSEEPLAAIVDGQHRLYGFLKASPARQDMLLACAIFLELPTPQQAAIFATINYNQKPVSKSQTYELFGYNLDEEPPESWSPDKFAVFLARKLNVDPQSPFCHHIQVAAQDDRVLDEEARARGEEWSVSTATIVESVMKLISSSPKADRDELHKYGVETGRQRQVLRNVKRSSSAKLPPLRELYLDTRDIVIYGLIVNYLTAANEVFWKRPNPGFIRRTVGIQALFEVLGELLPEQLATNEKDLTQNAWQSHLVKAKNIDFTDRLFNASGSGRTRIKIAMLLAMQRRSLADVDEQLRPDFQRVLGST
jgi:DNA phosphorothioation-associated DGQHR protein 1